MAQIKSEYQYEMLLKKIERLMDIVDDNTPPTDPDYIELDLLTDLVEEYETEHYPIETPSLIDVIKLRIDRKSTRLNSSHVRISYAVFCLKKKKKKKNINN